MCQHHEKAQEEQGKVNNVAIVSGGFDPIHVGHIRMFQEAARLGTLIVGLNSDEWLKRKKGYVFMPWEERAEIIRALRCVNEVRPFDDSSDTCIDLLAKALRDFPQSGWEDIIFCNGGDRKLGTTPEVEFCEEQGITLAWGIGGESKVQSSSHLVRNSRIPIGVDPRNPSDWVLWGPQGSD